MTLRYGHDGKPCGLDWSVCNDGNPRPEVWGGGLAADKPKVRAVPRERKPPAALINPDLPRTKRNRMAPEVEAEIIRLYRDRKMSANEVGRVIGTTAVTVFKVLERNEIPTRSRAEAMTLHRARD